MYSNVLFMLTYLAPWGDVGTSQVGVDTWDGLVGTIPFVRVETLPNQVGSTAL